MYIENVTDQSDVYLMLQVQNLTVTRLCNRQLIVAVNGSFPGPRIRVREGDTLIVHVYNKSPYNLTVHWLVLSPYFHLNWFSFNKASGPSLFLLYNHFLMVIKT